TASRLNSSLNFLRCDMALLLPHDEAPLKCPCYRGRTHLFDRRRCLQPYTYVLRQVPLTPVDDLRHLDIERVRLALAFPVPAVPGDDAGPVAFLVPLGDQFMEFGRRVDHPKVELFWIQSRIGGLPDSKDIVQPRQVPVRAIAAELRGKLQPRNGCASLGRDLLNGPSSADICQGNDLVVIREKDRAIGASDQFRDLVLAQVAVEPRLEVEPVSFIDDEGVEGTWRGVDEAS